MCVSERLNPSSSSEFPPKKILVPTDGSDNARRAERVAVRLAKDYGAELTILYVAALPAYLYAAPSPFGGAPVADLKDIFQTAEKEGKKLVDNSVEYAKSQGAMTVGNVLTSKSSVVFEITQYAQDNNVDLIVIGTRGLGGFKKMLMGSVSSGVVAHAHCNVIVVK